MSRDSNDELLIMCDQPRITESSIHVNDAEKGDGHNPPGSVAYSTCYSSH